jgi:hypothetical protein
MEELLRADEENTERQTTMDSEEQAIETVTYQKATPGQRKRREIFKCPHTDKKHYAKNMCHNCYHRKGKTKVAYACGHTERSHYSSGMCQNCYLAKYYLKRKNKASEKAKAKTESETQMSAFETSSGNAVDSCDGVMEPKRHNTTSQVCAGLKFQKVE